VALWGYPEPKFRAKSQECGVTAGFFQWRFEVLGWGALAGVDRTGLVVWLAGGMDEVLPAVGGFVAMMQGVALL